MAGGIGLLTAGAGVLALLSWLLSIEPRLPMLPYTALCFTLIGLVLWLRLRQPRPAYQRLLLPACAMAVVVISGLMLVEHVLGADLGIDLLLFRDALTTSPSPTPGRMSLATSLCMAGFGLALLLLDAELPGGQRPAQYLVLAVMLLALLGLEGNLFGPSEVFRTFPFAAMAWPAALLFVVLGFGVLWARSDRGLLAVVNSHRVGGLMARWLLPVAILLPLAIAWPRLQGERLGWYETEPGLVLMVTSAIIIFAVTIWFSARRLNLVDAERERANALTTRALADLMEVNDRLKAEVAERQRAEAVARISEQRFVAIFASSPSGMVVSSLPDLRYVDVNQSWLAMTGYRREQVIGKTAEEVGLIEPHERTALYAGLNRSGVLRNVDLRFRTSSGDHRYGRVSVERLVVDGDAFQVTSLVDITDRVQVEADLRDSNLRLETAVSDLRVAQQQLVEQARIAALGQLASGIAHDFNNTLGPILGYSDLLLANPEQLADRETATEYLEAINTAAQGAAGVVSRLRDFYRRRHNGDDGGPVHLPDVIAQAISIARPRWKDQAQASGVMIEVRAEVEEIEPIEGSPSELRDALVNLILNAVDAMPSGGTVTLRARAESGQDARSSVVVEVIDTGTGMSDEVRQRCLEPFFTTKGEHGTGLGLSIVHGTLRRLAGVLEIESAVGQGTTMRLKLLARRPVAEATLSPAEPEPPTNRVLRVLVVDDEPLMREVIARFLRLDDHIAEVAGGGREALARLASEPPFDLVITDRAMPDLGGDELAATIKERSPGLPVLMLTGFADLMGGVDALPTGVDLVIGKPTTLARLRVAIATLTGESQPAYDLNPQ